MGSVSTEGKRELTQCHPRWSFGRRLRREAVLGEQPGGGGRFGSYLDPAHRSSAATAGLHLGAEGAAELILLTPAAQLREVRRASVVLQRWIPLRRGLLPRSTEANQSAFHDCETSPEIREIEHVVRRRVGSHPFERGLLREEVVSVAIARHAFAEPFHGSPGNAAMMRS